MNRKKALAAFLVLLSLTAGYYLICQEHFLQKNTSIQATGTIEATTVELTAKLSGTIENFSCKEGDKVEKGQLVADLSRSDLAAQKEQAALGVLAAEAKLNDLLAGARSQEIKEAAANADMARLNYEKAVVDLNRAEELFEKGAISQEDLEKAELNAELKKNQLAAAEAKLSLLESGNRPQQIAMAQAEVQQYKAALKASEALLEDLKIISPINGTVISKNYEEGEYVQMGTSLATVADLNNLWIKVYIPTDDLPAIKLGQKAAVTVSGSDKIFSGTVKDIAPKGEFTPKTIQTKKERTNVVFAVEIAVEDSEGTLKPGMPADVVFK
ncbi:MAG: efflux RND transporter periplasmic adaptor subunit [Syntrophomonadaceae bacterium]|nr:efflux RND transporter periplasmic adaptor subunit [Syntrophomonadaceae bacterium]